MRDLQPDRLPAALNDAVRRHLDMLRSEFAEGLASAGLRLRDTAVGWSELTQGFQLAGGLSPAAKHPIADVFDEAVIKVVPFIETELLTDPKLALAGGELEWDRDRNTFDLSSFTDVATNQETPVPNPKDQTPPDLQPEVTPNGAEKAPAAVADAPDLETDAEKAQRKEGGDKPESA